MGHDHLQEGPNMSLSKIIKLVFGVIVIIGMTTCLPFFDNLPWNLPGYEKRSAVRKSLAKLAEYPPVTAQKYAEMREARQNNDFDQAMQTLSGIYPSPLRMICSTINRKSQWRAWGLVAVKECFPRNAMKSNYAPPLDLLIQWLKDTDTLVASNALAALQTYAVLPEDTYEPNKTYTTAQWHTIYDNWMRKDEPAWHQIECRYYCKRNWPPPIQ
jgi:hypothetical protein